jgi:hypothetical protein
MANMGTQKGIFAIVRDLELEGDCPGLRASAYKITSPKDPKYNCIAYAAGDTSQWWEDTGNIKVRGYYWPPGAQDADALQGWMRLFEIHGYVETTDRSLEIEYEKIAIYASADGPEHVARQKASGAWTSKAGSGIDMEHALESLEGDLYGKVVKVMKRKCQGGKRVLE